MVYLLIILVNTLVVVGIGAMIFIDKKKSEKENLVAAVEASGEAPAEGEAPVQENLGANLVPLDMFLVNLSGTKGNKLLKVTLELDVENTDVQKEIDSRKPQIRDIIIMLLSSKDYQEVVTNDGKERLRDEIKDTLNSFLTKGKVKKVLYTEFIFN